MHHLLIPLPCSRIFGKLTNVIGFYAIKYNGLIEPLARNLFIAKINDKLCIKESLPNYFPQLHLLQKRKVGLCKFTSKSRQFISFYLSQCEIIHLPLPSMKNCPLNFHNSTRCTSRWRIENRTKGNPSNGTLQYSIIQYS